jgi:hypothetical protein
MVTDVLAVMSSLQIPTSVADVVQSVLEDGVLVQSRHQMNQPQLQQVLAICSNNYGNGELSFSYCSLYSL